MLHQQEVNLVEVLRQVSNASILIGRRLPSSLVSKGFTFSQGKINLEATLDREIYYHGEKISANIVVTNNSRKTVKSIKWFEKKLSSLH